MSYLHTQRLLGEHLTQKHHVRQSKTVTFTQIMTLEYTHLQDPNSILGKSGHCSTWHYSKYMKMAVI